MRSTQRAAPPREDVCQPAILRRNRRGCLFLGVALSACGPDNDPPSTWMLGVFSGQEPGPATGRYAVQYHVTEEGDSRTLDFLVVDVQGVVEASSRTWERRGGGEIAMFRAPDDIDDTSVLEWTVLRDGACGPHQVTAHYEARDLSAGLWFPGEVCVRDDTHCPDEGCPIEDPDPFEYYWCDEPAPPCESDSE